MFKRRERATSGQTRIELDNPSGKVVKCDFLQKSPDLGTQLWFPANDTMDRTF